MVEYDSKGCLPLKPSMLLVTLSSQVPHVASKPSALRVVPDTVRVIVHDTMFVLQPDKVRVTDWMSLALTFALFASGSALASAVPNPAVQGPIEGGVHGYAWNHSLFPLSTKAWNYTEREYFYSGMATNLAQGASAPYESRMLVRLPSDPRKFNGTVVAVPNLQTVCGGAAFGHALIKGLQDVVNTIAQGRSGSDMPSWSVKFAGAMDDQQINDVVNYLISIQKVPKDQNVCTNPAAVSPKPSATASASPSGGGATPTPTASP